VHLAYIWIISHLSAKNYRNWWKFDEVLTKTNLLSFFGTRCSYAWSLPVTWQRWRSHHLIRYSQKPHVQYMQTLWLDVL